MAKQRGGKFSFSGTPYLVWERQRRESGRAIWDLDLGEVTYRVVLLQSRSNEVWYAYRLDGSTGDFFAAIIPHNAHARRQGAMLDAQKDLKKNFPMLLLAAAHRYEEAKGNPKKREKWKRKSRGKLRWEKVTPFPGFRHGEAWLHYVDGDKYNQWRLHRFSAVGTGGRVIGLDLRHDTRKGKVEHHTHQIDTRGKSKREINQEMFTWARDKIIDPLEILARALDNPTRGKGFTPSYPAATQAEYDAWVKKCQPYAHLPWEKRPKGCKRLDHVMIEGGRQRSRGIAGPLPRTLPRTTTRLSGPNPPWDARTQPEDLRPRTTAGKIRKAIGIYRQTAPRGAQGFYVPGVAGPLIDAGMPEKAAYILVERAGNSWFPEVSAADLMAPVGASLADVANRLALPLGGLVMEKTGKKGRGFEEGPLYQIQPGQAAMRADYGYLADIAVGVGEGRDSLLRSEEDISNEYAAFRASVERMRPYNRPTDDPTFFQRFWAGVAADAAAPNIDAEKPGFALVLYFYHPKKGTEGTELRGRLSYGEHSKLRGSSARPGAVKYRTLENVSLAELPELLAGLAKRKKLKGRQLTPKTNSASPTRGNPMAKKSYWERQYQMGPYGASRSVPAARRNKSRKKKRKARKNLSPAQIAAGFGGTAAKNRLLRNNPWYPGTPSLYLPDTTTVRSSLVEAPVPWDDATEVRSALVAGPYGAKKNRKRKATKKRRSARKNGLALKNVGRDSKGRFVSKRRKASKSRRNVSALANVGRDSKGRFVSKRRGRRNSATGTRHKLGRSPETGMWAHHPVYEQARGQFGVSEGWTHGLQPMNRRNPPRDSKGRFKKVRGKSRYNPRLKRAAYLKGYAKLPDDILVDMMMDGDPAAAHEWELRSARKSAKKLGWKGKFRSAGTKKRRTKKKSAKANPPRDRFGRFVKRRRRK